LYDGLPLTAGTHWYSLIFLIWNSFLTMSIYGSEEKQQQRNDNNKEMTTTKK